MSRAIGIDLGTTNSCAAVVENGQPVIIPNSGKGRTTPSVVAFPRGGGHLVGEKAKRQLSTNTERTVSSVKRQMGTDWSVKIDGKSYKPQEISAMILSELKKDAEEFTGEEITDAVITVPAYFDDVQRQATKDAGKIAGLNVLRIVNEPTSAALSYGLDHADPQKILVYDLGGGTFDVSVIEITNGVLEVLSTAGNNRLGGDDFDKRIMDWVVYEFNEEYKVDLKRDVTAYQRVREAAEQAKKELSSKKETKIDLPYIAQRRGETLHLEKTLTREKFYELIEDLVEKTEAPVKDALEEAGLRPEQLGKVLLVGGSTRMPVIREKVRKMLKQEPSGTIDPDECVAMGAAILASTLTGNTLVVSGTGNDLLLLDVIPMSFAIQTSDKSALKLIERNTTVPTSVSRVFSTAKNNQRDVEIRVLQGERPLAKDNKLIGRFRLSGIRKAQAGIPRIKVTFDVDINGLLTVSAKDLDTEEEQSISITASDRMSDKEVERAVWEAKEFAKQDKLSVEALDLFNEAGELATKTEQALENAGKQIERAERKEIQKRLKAVQRYLQRLKVDEITRDEIDRMRRSAERLREAGEEVREKFGV